MGLFDFASNIGHKLFNDDEDAAEKIKAHVEAQNPGIENLEVSFINGLVTLCGQAESCDAAEKAVLMAGNVSGVKKVINDIEAPAPTETVEYYEIQSGDTLSKIAKRYYGDAMKYPEIFEANREVIQDPDKIFVGQKIRIPLTST